jgi:hypothetical protein
MRHLITPSMRHRELLIAPANARQQTRQILQAMSDEMDDFSLPLNPSVHLHHASGENDPAPKAPRRGDSFPRGDGRRLTGPHVERSRAIVLSDDHADLLRCRNGAPGLAVERRDFAQSGVAVEFTGTVPTPTTSWRSAMWARAEGLKAMPRPAGRDGASGKGRPDFQRSANPLLLRERLRKRKMSIALRHIFR